MSLHIYPEKWTAANNTQSSGNHNNIPLQIETNKTFCKTCIKHLRNLVGTVFSRKTESKLQKTIYKGCKYHDNKKCIAQSFYEKRSHNSLTVFENLF